MTATLTNRFKPFDLLADAALELTAFRRGHTLRKASRTAILKRLTALPPHPDVAGALEELRAAGLRIAALTNGTSAGVAAQLRHARLAGHFEMVFAADQVRRYKPARDPYAFAVAKLRTRASDVHLVAAHAWDIAGAAAAGLRTVFVRRAGKTLPPTGPRADIEVADLGELARNIVKRRQRGHGARSAIA
jgi:2-haloacid dehalogenase